MRFDIFKLGIFFLGISAIIFALISLHWYYNMQRESPFDNRNPFFVRCVPNEKVIIIDAYSTLANVSVKDKNNNTICSYSEIKSGSEEACFIGNNGIFIVESNGWKRIIICTNQTITMPYYK